MRVVHYSKYFIWFEAGSGVELLRSVGILFKDFEKRGYFFPVIEAVANYRAPARFDDEILLRTKVAKIGNTSIRFENQVLKLAEETLIRSTS
jgi:acyl-CoA thioester hydrolase